MYLCAETTCLHVPDYIACGYSSTVHVVSKYPRGKICAAAKFLFWPCGLRGNKRGKAGRDATFFAKMGMGGGEETGHSSPLLRILEGVIIAVMVRRPGGGGIVQRRAWKWRIETGTGVTDTVAFPIG